MSVRDLWVTSHTPEMGVGRALRSYAIVRALAVHRGVDVIYIPIGQTEEIHPAYRALDDVRFHKVLPSRGPRRAATYARHRLAGVPAAYARGASSELTAAATRLAAAPDRGRVVVDGLVPAAAMLRLAGRRPVVYCAHNLESAFRPESQRLEPFERRVLQTMAESWMASPTDLEGARALAPGATLRYAPNAVDVAAFPAAWPPPRTGRALFTADYLYPPNREALAFLLDEVMPRVWVALPKARLAVVGRGLELPAGVDERIEPRGFVDDLGAEYARAACACVPLLSGGGSPLKFVEALARGLPVVATPRAAAGLEAVAGEHYVEAAGAEAYAAALTRVLRDGADEMAAAGRAFAAREHSIEALAEKLAP